MVMLKVLIFSKHNNEISITTVMINGNYAVLESVKNNNTDNIYLHNKFFIKIQKKSMNLLIIVQEYNNNFCCVVKKCNNNLCFTLTFKIIYKT